MTLRQISHIIEVPASGNASFTTDAPISGYIEAAYIQYAGQPAATLVHITEANTGDQILRILGNQSQLYLPRRPGNTTQGAPWTNFAYRYPIVGGITFRVSLGAEGTVRIMLKYEED